MDWVFNYCSQKIESRFVFIMPDNPYVPIYILIYVLILFFINFAIFCHVCEDQRISLN